MVGSLVNKRKASRDSIILRLSMLGWTQDDISKAVVRAGYEKTYSQVAVNKVLKLFLELKKVIIPQFDSDKPIKDIVKENEKYYGLDEKYVVSTF